MEDYVILKAIESNCACHNIRDWENNGFQVFNSGILYVCVNSNINIVDCRTFITKDDLVAIKECIAAFNEIPMEKLICLDSCDGTEWSFISYDEDNNICGKSFGYVNHIDVLDHMAKILKSYIPKYSVHTYEDEYSSKSFEECEKNAPKPYYCVSDEED